MVPYQHYWQGPSMTERMLQATKEMALTAAATSKAAAVAASKKSMDTIKGRSAAKEKTSSDFEKLLLYDEPRAHPRDAAGHDHAQGDRHFPRAARA